MFKTRAALLGVLALLIASGITASTASATGPYWRVNGARLGQGVAKQIKLQVKTTATIETKIIGVAIRFACKNGISEGATIEGQGQFQGQDKGRLVFTQCSVPGPGETQCRVKEPLTTAQLKSHLGTYNGGQLKYADLFEPTQGTVFATLTLENAPGQTCSIVGSYEISGSVAAALTAETEVREGLLVFPAGSLSITEVFVEQQAKKPKLKFGAEKAEFTAGFDTRLESGEAFGVFGT